MYQVRIIKGTYVGRTGTIIGQGNGWLVSINNGEIIAEFPTAWLGV